MTLRPGLELISEQIGEGPPVRRHAYYRFSLRMWLHGGQPVRWDHRWGLADHPEISRIEEDGALMFTTARVDRTQMFGGLFHGIQGMNVGGTRVLRVAPHLAYGALGIPGVIPPNSALTVELVVVAPRDIE